jgi:hypothetical protein
LSLRSVGLPAQALGNRGYPRDVLFVGNPKKSK